MSEKQTMNDKFWQWIADCPEGVHINHESTDKEDKQFIYVFGFAVKKEAEDD